MKMDMFRIIGDQSRESVESVLKNVFHCDIAEIRFVGKVVIIRTFS